ncbi:MULTISPECIES: aminoacyl-tRNA hydrolase [Clostridium]|jgi:PTH1 family peptidyl-tRNA hydrolase|uniref:Peptidyl-tRNA hydrolase n=1 Tax=Clostridium saccharoperbutylacetonicum N1-4(HMT) TaxID=931276 RepID=M1MBX3_9CLOT|nr:MULTISPECIES: aminoacyl-tRNA hydrolase [Clostridium]AGF53943.1 peptidyl-tRNA hydrolase Pth [Clostridium saccharoperbutylacetonicum N1-4(HMT)]AQR92847.1 peptidyl-tRNA hydrolase [Clostridium saccharoperbutylacetonicum]NRT59544.1 PTH1 family peptidyl-tRNA hydrolase [Clostridium saccharoperbutylacetonicum]NSB28736.1 PTH1 family peptidyl-tRNA hydrolase [Clostridium saccharoperbutylacetonicum]NSB34258.1 PTH1 family peptidyl-tRNA hydrolase [Clostridium saccharoperbutylacetonicum]
MFLIVGLGNPGKEYEDTRHNIGFKVVDNIAKEYNIQINRQKFKGIYGEGFINGQKVILLKPTTYMNLSGESVREVVNFYNIENDEILIIYDDISLDVGKLRIREKGSAGGHNGIKSIIAHLGSEVFSRIKIGVGQPNSDLVKHVLGKFSKEEMVTLDESIEAATNATAEIIKNDVKTAMNQFNGFKASTIS